MLYALQGLNIAASQQQIFSQNHSRQHAQACALQPLMTSSGRHTLHVAQKDAATSVNPKPPGTRLHHELA